MEAKAMNLLRRSRIAASPGMGVETRASDKQGRARGEQGQALVEFALGVPLLLILILVVAMFGIAFNTYLTLTFATSNATQALSISRGVTTDPCQTVAQAVYAAAPQLNHSNLKFTILVYPQPASSSTSCTTGTPTTLVNSTANPSCSGDLCDLAQGDCAAVTVTYPCNLQTYSYRPFLINSIAYCTLTAQSIMVIQ